MNNPFKPEVSGKWQPDKLSKDIISALTERIRNNGLLAPTASKARNSYEILESGYDRLHFRSTGLLTSIAIGLNDVNVRIDQMQANTLNYTIKYWTWAKYSIFLCFGILILVPGILYFTQYKIISQSMNEIPGAVNSIPLFIFLGNALFWGLLWPWILIAIHKKHACRALEHILMQENGKLLRK